MSNLDLLSLHLCPGAPLSAALAAATALTELDLERTPMGSSGARALAAEVLPGHSNLSTLDLGSSDMDEDAALAVVAGLGGCRALRRVVLCGAGHGISDAVVGELAKISPQLAEGAYYPECGWWADEEWYLPDGWQSEACESEAESGGGPSAAAS